ncbi:MAG: bifunctional phosphoribosylaminoimidazolecarboxamide formyltransferase/IMP cyclohydrolase [Candidatus Kapabacteria bacterium]|nr:bifunctional phosphoribosylaminoimidazolecarboxamide formyltransferase/IMP cyclohydrolase [Candidatus Kapabacteria bacterium]
MKTPETHQIKKALISVSDKNGIVEFASKLSELGIDIYSTGGTATLLKKSGINVLNVSDLISFPEILDGRVKTLHPIIHAGLLADLGKHEHLEQLTKHGISSIDLLIVNLYPFEETLSKVGVEHDELIENIDIGGPTMLRSAAKNYKWTAPVVNPARYDEILKMLIENNLCIGTDYRCNLAGDVFSHTAYYDSLISGYFNKTNEIGIPDKFAVPMKVYQGLRYGENPHQLASFYGNFEKIYQKLHGKELSYNNILDIDGASKLCSEFSDPAFIIIKHTNPCGVGVGENLIDAYNKALSTDNVSAFGGIFAVNRIMDLDTAKVIHGIFSEVIIAPDYTDEALELLSKKKDRRLIRINYENLKIENNYDFRAVAGGVLFQQSDKLLVDKDNLKVVTKRQPTEEEYKALMFAWTIAKHVKSNTIVYANKDRTLGIGAGQMSRVDSSRIAIEKAKMMGLDLKGSAMASDAFFPFADGLLMAVEAGATAVIQPGGSVRDNEVIQVADENGIAMVFTGMRHFKH